MNPWLNRCVFNLDLNRESVSEPRTLSGRLFQSLGARYEKVLPPLVDFAILGTTKSPEFCDLKARTHRDEYRRALFASVFQRVFCVHTQSIFPDIRWRLM